MSETVDVRLTEWEALEPTGDVPAARALRGLELPDKTARGMARALARSNVLHVEELRSGIGIRATSYVGRVQLGRLRITIDPKLARESLLVLFRYAFGLRRLALFPSTTAGVGALFSDVLLEQLRVEVDELRRRGLVHHYSPRTEMLGSPRGRIDVVRLASRGGVLDASLPCRHSPRDADHVLNRAIVAGVALGARVAQSPDLRRDLIELGRKLDVSVRTPRLDRHLLDAAFRSLSRLTSTYEPALRILAILLDGLALELESGTTLAVPGFLFDMNRLFQALVERLLTDHLPDYELRAEQGIRGMLAFADNPRNRRAPQPRPDFTVTRPGAGGPLLLDAKYRDLWDKQLPREMLYQLALYALSQSEDRKAAIIYPSTSPSARQASIEVTDPRSGKRLAMVHLRPLPIHTLADAVTEERTDVLRDLALRAALGVSPHAGGVAG